MANTWFPHEVQLGEDLADFARMSDEERATPYGCRPPPPTSTSLLDMNLPDSHGLACCAGSVAPGTART